MLTYEKFSISPMKVRVLFVKKLLNTLNYNLDETFTEDKHYKKALRKYQIDNGLAGNCMLDIKIYNLLKNDVPEFDTIWNNMKR